jgi:DNA-binding PadR family transcriptional regulator
VWRPRPGSVYPALQQLEDEGLVRAEERDGSRVFTLTDEGRAHVESSDLGAPWEAVRDEQGEDIRDIRGLIAQVAAAAWQVGQAGTEAQITEARRLLAETRRALYRVLAEDGDES